MYITSELFRPAPSSDGQEDNSPHPRPQPPLWTAMAGRPAPALGKRKRRADEEDAPNAITYGPHCSQHARISTLMLAPSGSQLGSHAHSNHAMAPSKRPLCSSSSRPLKQLKRTVAKSRPQSPPSLSKSSSHLMDLDNDGSEPGPSTKSPPKSPSQTTFSADALRPCHICYKPPKRKQEIHNFVECQ
ncbi:hypothetical protein P154DRAFT_400383, partial [Amniculicola lignicola CBS 123094]